MENKPSAGRDWGELFRSTLPILQWLPQYRVSWLRSDVVAGLTLAAYAIPVSVAYASLAGLPPQAGLYCYLLGGIAYAAVGTSRQLAIGPTSAISILIASGLGLMSNGDMFRQSHLAMAVAVLTGFIGITAWALRLGNISNFVSETILSGFKVGAGLVIASTQLPKLFGVLSGGGNFFTRIVELSRHLGETNSYTLAIGLGALALLILGERFLPRRPIALFVVVISIAVMSFFPLASKGVRTVGAIPEGLPHFGWPVVQWGEVDDLLGIALAVFLLSYVESISVARTFSRTHRHPIDADQELLALGAANLAAGLGQGYPLAGGMSQSVVNEKGGAHTPIALIIASGGIGVVLLYLTGLLRNLPDSVLAAVVLIAVGGLIRPRELLHLYHVSKMEFRVAMVATVGVLSFGILKGVLLATVFSILLLLRRASRPRIALLGRLPGMDRFADRTRYPEVEMLPGVLILRVEAGLFYFNAQNVKREVLHRMHQYAAKDLIVMDLSTSATIDLAGARMLSELQEDVRQTGASLALAEVHGQVRDLLQAEGLSSRIPGIVQRMRIASFIGQRKHTMPAAS
ncbi:MAG TPA: SulP family inorganic anion transporter [Terriglobales bacterium]|nr:SulP family inorganic anion transporter [Terriglobales bacterium]